MSRLAPLSLLAALVPGAPAIASAAPARPLAAQVVAAPASPAPATPRDSARYAEREQEDKAVASYEGGSATVLAISGSAVLVLFSVFLLLI